MGFHKFMAKLRERINGFSIAICSDPLNNSRTLKGAENREIGTKMATTFTVIVFALLKRVIFI